MLVVRKAAEKDCKTIYTMIRELARFEKLEDQITGSAEDLRHVLFEERVGYAMIVELASEPIGYCLYYFNVSTFKCKKGLYVEDIYIRPEHRGSGIGTMVLQNLARIAESEQCGRMEWMCLDWNTTAQELYTKLGAEKMNQWQLFRVDDKKLGNFWGKCTCCGNK